MAEVTTNFPQEDLLRDIAHPADPLGVLTPYYGDLHDAVMGAVAEIDRLRARVAALEEAGDAIAAKLMPCGAGCTPDGGCVVRCWEEVRGG